MRFTHYANQPVVLLAPLLIWAGHFLFVYILTAVACARYPSAGAVLPILWLASAAALLLTGLLGRSFYRRLRRNGAATSDRGLALRTGLMLSLVSLIAIAWTTLPTLFLHPCG